MKLFQKRRLVYTLILAFSLSSTVFGVEQPRKSVPAAKEYCEYAILYWTLRRMEQDETGVTAYSSKFGPCTGGSLIASVPNIHKKGHYERPLPFFPKEDSKKHLTVNNINPLQGKEFFDDLKSRVTQSCNKSVLIMIHGYDYHFDEVAYRAGQFLHDSGFDGTLIMFSWPSFGEMGENGYSADIEHAMMSIAGLADFLCELPKAVPEANISIFAHSLGCRIVCNALTQLDKSNVGGNRPLFDQLILAAPDVDYEAFVQVSSLAVRRSSKGVTVYVSQRDKALKISSGFHGDRRRLGDASCGSVLLDGIDVVDATHADNHGRAEFGHMYPFSSLEIIKDIVEITRGISIDQRSLASGRVNSIDSVARSSNQ